MTIDWGFVIGLSGWPTWRSATASTAVVQPCFRSPSCHEVPSGKEATRGPTASGRGRYVNAEGSAAYAVQAMPLNKPSFRRG